MTLTREQELALVEALDNGGVVQRPIPILEGMTLIKSGLVREVQNRDTNGKKLEGWSAHLELTDGGKFSATLIRERDQAREVLREVEWQWSNSWNAEQCKSCLGLNKKDEGHEPDCKLKAALGGE